MLVFECIQATRWTLVSQCTYQVSAPYQKSTWYGRHSILHNVEICVNLTELSRITPPPRHTEIGTVSLPTSWRQIGLNFPALHRNWFFQLCFHFTPVDYWEIYKRNKIFWLRYGPLLKFNQLFSNLSTHLPNCTKIDHSFFVLFCLGLQTDKTLPPEPAVKGIII